MRADWIAPARSPFVIGFIDAPGVEFGLA